MDDYSLDSKSVNHFRSQEYDLEQPLEGRSYTGQYRRKETDGVEDISELFHENTKLGPKLVERLKKSALDLAEPIDGICARIDPDFPDKPRVELPEPPELTADFGEVLESRSSAEAFGRGSFDGEQLSQCLHYAVGRPNANETSRTYPSPGGLYPSELYPVLFDVDGFEPGLYHYNHDGHYLREMDTFSDEEALFDRVRECVHTSGIIPDVSDICALFLVSADFWRAKFKYGPRGYRYVLQESGHVAQNLVLTLTAMGLAGRPLAAFRDRNMNDFVGLDGVNDAVTYMVAAGHEGRRR